MLATLTLRRLVALQPLWHRAAAHPSPAAATPALTALRSYASKPASTSDHPTPPSQASPSEPAAQAASPESVQASSHQSQDKALTGDGSLAASFFDLPAQGGSGNQQRAKRMSSIEKRRQNMSRILGLFGLAAAGVGAWTLSRPFDESAEDARLKAQMRLEMGLTAGQELPEGLSGRYYRCKTRGLDLMDFLNKPAWDPLLPPPLPPTHQRPYTLVIELDDLLVHSQWSRDNGWRTAKRPGIQEFLGYLSQFYEIVVFTEAPHYTAMPLLDKIDPLQYYFVYRLFRDSTRYYNRSLVKDLSYLGRDLSKVIMLDTDGSHTQLQPENSILLPRWSGNPRDDSLATYLPFLEAIGINSVPDVRPLIKAYEGKNIPAAFAERQAEYKRKHVEEWEAKRQANPLSGFNIGSLFGISSQQTKADEPPPTFFEAERKKHMDLYEAEKNFFKANETKMLETMEADRQRQMKEMGSSFLGFVEAMGKGGAPKPPDQPQQSK